MLLPEVTMIFNEDCLDTLGRIKDESIDLVIADPPYWKVVNQKWDRMWKTEYDYVEWSLKWISEVSRVLRYGGTFYLFGYYRTLALLISQFDKVGLNLRQQIIIDKGIRSVAGRATANYKMFPNVTESLLLIVKDNKKFIKPYLKERKRVKGISSKAINEGLGFMGNGGGMWSIYTGDNVCEQFPTKEAWSALQEMLDFNIPYEKVAQTFNPEVGITDVWTDIDFYKEKRIHPTQKPESLIKRLILASSNEGDKVYDPFMGSGTTAKVCRDYNRECTGSELSQEYWKLSLQRLSN